jgi:hypothetical protein
MLDNFWVKLLGVAIVVYGLYYAISPYQNCLRSEGGYAEYVELFLKQNPPENPFMSERFLPSSLPPGFKPVGGWSEEEWRRDLKMRCVRVAAW